MEKKLIVFMLIIALGIVLANLLTEKPQPKKQMELMTWAEIESKIKDNPVVVIPLGAASKEHGLHLPMNTDKLTANYLRDRIIQKVDNILVAPTINYSYYPAFIEYPGSTTLNLNTSTNMIVEICRTLHQQGFTKFYVINVGLSTTKALEKAKDILKNEGVLFSYSDLDEVDNLPAVKNIHKEVRGTHAGELETSFMLYVAPHLVNMKKAQRDDNPELIYGPLTRNPTPEKGVYSPTGTWGDPTLATKKKGKIVTDAIVAYVVQQINELNKKKTTYHSN